LFIVHRALKFHCIHLFLLGTFCWNRRMMHLQARSTMSPKSSMPTRSSSIAEMFQMQTADSPA
jgi:hypothetical protein